MNGNTFYDNLKQTLIRRLLSVNAHLQTMHAFRAFFFFSSEATSVSACVCMNSSPQRDEVICEQESLEFILIH